MTVSLPSTSWLPDPMKYKLRVLRAGQLEDMIVDAGTVDEAESQAAGMGFTVLEATRAGVLSLSPRPRGRAFSLVLFCQQLIILLDSGLSLMEAMEALGEREGDGANRRMLEDVIGALHQGVPFSAALARHPASFPALFIALVRASEQTSNLSETLSRHVAYLSQMDVVRKRVIGASIYPALLLTVGVLVIGFLLGYVVPRFSTLFESGGHDLPWVSRMLMTWGRTLHDNGQLVAAGLLAAVIVIGHQLTRPRVRRRLLDTLWRVPAVGEALRVYQLSRCFRTLGMLLRGGIPLVTGMDMVGGLLHPSMRAAFAQAGTDVRQGKPLSAAMETHGLSTPISLRMLRVGERTGRLGEMMERVSVFHDDEIGRRIEWVTRVFEPVLMIVIGLVVGAIVTLLYMPIFDLAGSIQ